MTYECDLRHKIQKILDSTFKITYIIIHTILI